MVLQGELSAAVFPQVEPVREEGGHQGQQTWTRGGRTRRKSRSLSDLLKTSKPWRGEGGMLHLGVADWVGQ